MWRKFVIALASVIFFGAMAASTTAEARMGGFGGGFRGGGFHGGGIHAGGFRGGFAGPRFASHRFVHPGFARFHRPFFHRRFAFARFHRFHHRRFAFAAVPFVVGAGIYADSCWRLRWTPWGWRRIWACDYY